MILHLSHIFFTEGRTFICLSFRKLSNVAVLPGHHRWSYGATYVIAQPQA